MQSSAQGSASLWLCGIGLDERVSGMSAISALEGLQAMARGVLKEEAPDDLRKAVSRLTSALLMAIVIAGFAIVKLQEPQQEKRT